MRQIHRQRALRVAATSTALAVLTGLTLLLGAGQALAHTRLLSSTPAEGANLAGAPDRVSLTFSEAIQADFSTVTVTGPDGTTWQSGAVTADGATVSIALRPLRPAGRYEIGYRVVSDDGHPVTGKVGFVLTAAGAAAAPPAPVAQASPPAPAGDIPVWPWIVGAVVLLGAGVIAALRLGRT